MRPAAAKRSGTLGEEELRMRRPWSRWLAWAGAGATAVVFSLSPTGSVAASLGASGSAAGGAVAPNAIGMMDCNSHSPVFKSVKSDLGGGCADPIAIEADG